MYNFSPFSSYPSGVFTLGIIAFTIWIIILYVTSRMGWKQLAAKFKYFSSVQGHQFSRISCKVGRIHYIKLCRIVYNADGFYIKLPYIFRMICPPLFIPWQEIQFKGEARSIGRKVMEMKIENQTVQIPYSLYEKINAELRFDTKKACFSSKETGV